MDNVVLVTFEDEGKAYEEFNRLKDNEATADFTILEMAVVKNVDGAIMVPDGFQDGYDETDNTAFGGVIGAVVGLLGGELVHALEAHLPPLDAFDRFPGSSALAMQRLG